MVRERTQIGVEEVRRRARAATLFSRRLEPSAVCRPKPADFAVPYLAVAMTRGFLSTDDPTLPESYTRELWPMRPMFAIPYPALAEAFSPDCAELTPDARAYVTDKQVEAAREEIETPVLKQRALYITFASGTTRVQKGVVCCASGIEHVLGWTFEHVFDGARNSSLSAPFFDVSIWRHIVVFAASALLHVVDVDLGLLPEARGRLGVRTRCRTRS